MADLQWLTYYLHLLSVPLYVGMLLTIDIGETSGKLVQIPTDATAMVGHPAHFNCSTSKRPVKECALWWYIPPGEGEESRIYIYDGGRMRAEFRDRMYNDINESSGAFNLEIRQPLLNDSGTYQCWDEHGHTGASAELVVLGSNWVCQSNMDPEGLVWPTACDETITPNELKLSCSVTYAGTGKYVPEIEWKLDGHFFTPLVLPIMKSGSKLTYYAAMKISPQMEGSIYICLKGTKHCSHVLNVSKELYAFGDTIKRHYTGDNVPCVANATRELPCSYRWYNDNTTYISSNSTFTPNDPGLYKCEAQCAIGNDICKSMTHVINVSESDLKVPSIWSTWSGLICGLLIVFGVIGVIVIVVVVVRICVPSVPLMHLQLVNQSEE